MKITKTRPIFRKSSKAVSNNRLMIISSLLSLKFITNFWRKQRAFDMAAAFGKGKDSLPRPSVFYDERLLVIDVDDASNIANDITYQ